MAASELVLRRLQEAGVRPRDLVQWLGVNRSTASLMLAGKRGIPIWHLDAVAELLGTDVPALFAPETVSQTKQQNNPAAGTSLDTDPEVQQEVRKIGGSLDADPSQARPQHVDEAKLNAEVRAIESIERDLATKLDAAAETVRSVADALRISRESSEARRDAADRARRRADVRKAATRRGTPKR